MLLENFKLQAGHQSHSGEQTNMRTEVVITFYGVSMKKHRQLLTTVFCSQAWPPRVIWWGKQNERGSTAG